MFYGSQSGRRLSLHLIFSPFCLYDYFPVCALCLSLRNRIFPHCITFLPCCLSYKSLCNNGPGSFIFPRRFLFLVLFPAFFFSYFLFSHVVFISVGCSDGRDLDAPPCLFDVERAELQMCVCAKEDFSFLFSVYF